MVSLLTQNGREITCFQTNFREKIITYFYTQEDEDWHKNVHKNGGSKKENIANTLSDMDRNVDFYVVLDGSKFAGFFGKFEQDEYKLLQGFHVGKEYRNTDFMAIFWRFIKMAIKGEFHCGLSSKNTKAINHLLKQGFEIVNEVCENEINYVILTLKN